TCRTRIQNGSEKKRFAWSTSPPAGEATSCARHSWLKPSRREHEGMEASYVAPTARDTNGEIGAPLHALATRLFPICRSLTGNGVRETLKILGEHIPLQIHEVPTGTRVLDWTIPKEWNIRDAFVQDENGNRVIDFRKNNLHVVGYSAPVD